MSNQTELFPKEGASVIYRLLLLLLPFSVTIVKELPCTLETEMLTKTYPCKGRLDCMPKLIIQKGNPIIQVFSSAIKPSSCHPMPISLLPCEGSVA